MNNLLGVQKLNAFKNLNEKFARLALTVDLALHVKKIKQLNSIYKLHNLVLLIR